jgi:putative membrane protein
VAFPVAAAASAAGGRRADGDKGEHAMKNLARRFLTHDEYQQIEAAVQAAEKRTSGEIVCMIQSASYHYPMANVIGAAAMGLPLALVLTPLIGRLYWIGPYNMWLFLGLFSTLFIILHTWIDHSAILKRRFISPKEIEEEVEEAAMSAFFRRGLYRTRHATGVLLFISVLERKVWILADYGINAKVAADQWNATVARLSEGIRQNRAAAAICEAIDAVGSVLEAHFPIEPDDRNELKDVIIDDGA